MVSGCGVIPLFVTGTFTPSYLSFRGISTPQVPSSTFAFSIGGLTSAPYSTHSTNIPNLLFWRFLQAVGAAPGLVLGAGVIGDIYKLEERGRAMSVFFAACLLGPALAPVVGGNITIH
ncbi:hypothetical protein BYT27DRAFT_7210296 [Phlegmacium glaucopus]|nr:hypothetical protein BYT27DRAFT_7210296 [Phlegmacium glaucopus]